MTVKVKIVMMEHLWCDFNFFLKNYTKWGGGGGGGVNG